jgi:hypothetical protein
VAESNERSGLPGGERRRGWEAGGEGQAGAGDAACHTLGEGDDHGQRRQQHEADRREHGGAGAKRLDRRKAMQPAALPAMPATSIPTSSAPAVCSKTPSGCSSVCSQVVRATKTPKTRRHIVRICGKAQSALTTPPSIAALSLSSPARPGGRRAQASASAAGPPARLDQEQPFDVAMAADGGTEQEGKEHAGEAGGGGDGDAGRTALDRQVLAGELAHRAEHEWLGDRDHQLPVSIGA